MIKFYPLFMVFFWVISCNEEQKEDKKRPIPPSFTNVVQVGTGNLVSTLTLPGELVSFQKVDLYAKENSFVKKVRVDIGSVVKKGELLATLEAPELNSQLNTAKAKMGAQESIWISTKFTYSKLLETSKTPGTISLNDLQEALAKRNSDSSQYVSTVSGYKEILNRISYLEIKAPFSGIISARNINDGSYVGPSGKGSDLPLFTLEEQDHLRLVVSAPEDDISNLHKGDNVSFTVRSFPGQVFKAQLVRLGGSLSNTLKSERLEMDIGNLDQKLIPGMTATVNLTNPSLKQTLLVQKSSIMETSHGTFVIKISNNNKAEYISVKRGNENEGLIEIFANLKPNDTIIKNANEEIREGSIITNLKIIH